MNGRDSNRAHAVTGDWPPPAVAAAAQPYPYITDSQRAPFTRPSDFLEAVSGRRRALSAAAAPPADSLAVQLRGMPTPIFERNGGERWTVHAAGVAAVVRQLRQLGFFAAFSARQNLVFDGEASSDYGQRQLRTFLAHYLDEFEWWQPTPLPRASGAAALFLSRVFDGEEPSRDEPFGAERAGEFQNHPVDEDDDPPTPWESRPSRLFIEQMIAASGRVTPFRLRPIVLVTENAAHRQWHYGAWAVYNTDPALRPADIAGIFGKHPRYQYDAWFSVGASDESRWVGRDMVWSGDDCLEMPGPHAEIRCAITGDVLYNWGRPSPAAAGRPAAAFVSQIPALLSSLSDEHDVVVRSGPSPESRSSDPRPVGVVHG